MNLDYVNKFIQPDLVLDVGCNAGHFYKEAKEVWPDAKYWLCEANMECSDILESLNVDFTIAVLSDKPKVVTFYTRKDSPCATGNSYYKENTKYYQGDNAVPHKVHTRTLDDVCSHLELSNQKVLLKIDSQGSEYDILRGGETIVENCLGIIVEVAYTDYNQGAPTASVVDQYIKKQGFSNYGAIGDIVHPESRELIQQDVLYLR
jgi:FkbM family methyltransferase